MKVCFPSKCLELWQSHSFPDSSSFSWFSCRQKAQSRWVTKVFRLHQEPDRWLGIILERVLKLRADDLGSNLNHVQSLQRDLSSPGGSSAESRMRTAPDLAVAIFANRSTESDTYSIFFSIWTKNYLWYTYYAKFHFDRLIRWDLCPTKQAWQKSISAHYCQIILKNNKVQIKDH